LVTPRPILSRQSSSSTTTTTGSTSSEYKFDFGSHDSPLRTDMSPRTINHEPPVIPPQIEENSMCLSPFEFTKAQWSLTTKFSQSTFQSNKGRRSVAATRRRLLRLAKENQQEDRMDVDSIGSPSIQLRHYTYDQVLIVAMQDCVLTHMPGVILLWHHSITFPWHPLFTRNGLKYLRLLLLIQLKMRLRNISSL
jgi:hypothetical protein